MLCNLRHFWAAAVVGALALSWHPASCALRAAEPVAEPSEDAEVVVSEDMPADSEASDAGQEPARLGEIPPKVLDVEPPLPAAPGLDPAEEDGEVEDDAESLAEPPAKVEQPEQVPADTAQEAAPKRKSKTASAPPARLKSAPDAAPLDSEDAAAPLDAATLNGVLPGTTTRAELRERWGKPTRLQKIAGGTREFYQLDNLGQVRVTIAENIVTSLAVQMARPLALAAMAERLKVQDVDAVDVRDESGSVLGCAFPEHGVMFGFVPRSKPPRVAQIILEPIDAEAFLDRAQVRSTDRYAACLADIAQALELNPKSGRAYHLHGDVALASGDLDAAMNSARQAMQLEPAVAEHRVLLARAFAAAGDYPQAIRNVRAVADNKRAAPMARAEACAVWGDCLAQQMPRDYAEATKQQQKAIELAEPLLADPKYSVRRAAKQLMVDAHLAVAYTIGWGHWQQKNKTVPKWIDRAEIFAQDFIETDDGRPELQVQVATGALAALAGVPEPPSADRWIKRIKEQGKALYATAEDEAYKAQLAWQLGRAMLWAVEVQASRHQAEDALNLGNVALALFDESQAMASRLPTHNYVRGQLCYRLGAVHALEQNDHVQAVAWFDRAAPLLESPVPATSVDPATQGEAFVSMAVSYWAQQNADEALRLTLQGVKLLEQAVEEGQLEETALGVPYANLASMYQELGNKPEAKKFSEMSARLDTKQRK